MRLIRIGSARTRSKTQNVRLRLDQLGWPFLGKRENSGKHEKNGNRVTWVLNEEWLVEGDKMAGTDTTGIRIRSRGERKRKLRALIMQKLLRELWKTWWRNIGGVTSARARVRSGRYRLVAPPPTPRSGTLSRRGGNERSRGSWKT